MYVSASPVQTSVALYLMTMGVVTSVLYRFAIVPLKYVFSAWTLELAPVPKGVTVIGGSTRNEPMFGG